MPVKITYFVHGTSKDNEAGISSGWKDIGLSELGIRQSLELKKILKDKEFDAVFCSDLKRAIETANLVFGNPILDKRLRECNYGKFNGLQSKIVEPKQEDHIFARFPGGESYEDVGKRMTSFLEFLKEKYRGKHIAIVSHKAPQLALDVLLKGRTWKQAFSEDWRRKKAWKPGWNYILK